MACPTCGERCTCPREGSARAAIVLDPEPHNQDSDDLPQGTLYGSEDVWRQEVASRVDAFCARRGRKRVPRPPSLRFDFERAARATAAAHYAVPEPEVQPPPPEPEPESSNVIEFPRVAPEPLPCLEPMPYVEQLAEPIIEKPRILDAEEPTGLLFGGEGRPAITLESNPEPDPRNEVGPVGQGASLSRRIFAGTLDAVLVTIACALFATIVLHMTNAMPASRTGWAMALALPVLLWATYQYLFLVYAAATPGMRAASLHIARFDGTPAPRSVRRWRAIAMVVSAMALGMGFLWASIDEYGLCWHDRITRTFPRRK